MTSITHAGAQMSRPARIADGKCPGNCSHHKTPLADSASVRRGQPTTINYYQGGRKGQGRIKIDSQELERLLELMFVSPKSQPTRRAPRKQTSMQHITTKLGRPDD
jgi:hypothetical protein